MIQGALVIPVVLGFAVAMGGTVWAKSDIKDKLQMSQNATVTIDQAVKTATERSPAR
jgi:hypothetical protein